MLALYILVLTFLIFIITYFLLNKIAHCPKNACFVVLGDIGRSPRSRLHCESLAHEGYSVDVVCYHDSEINQGVLDDENIQLHCLSHCPTFITCFPGLMKYISKTIWQAASLGFTLLLLPKAAFFIVQNPPTVPTLAVVWFVCFVRSSKLIIDWHNYGYTLLALSLSPRHILVKISKWFEKFFGRRSDKNICVTKAMQTDLYDKWNIKAEVLYDRPPASFSPCDISTSHALFTRLSNDYPCFGSKTCEETRFTIVANGQVRLKEDRPALVVSSTSWTEDEDFGILIEALQEYDSIRQKSATKLPDLVVAITGKGPLKEYYKDIINKKLWRHVHVCMPWLTAGDYPKLLGSADLGVCLHQSSSGLDLPMKIVDMFGCGLPVCAINFSCLDELVKHEENGLVFNSASELTQQMIDLFNDFPCSQIKSRFRTSIDAFRLHRWHANWKEVVLPLIHQL